MIYSCCPQLRPGVFAWFVCSGHARLAKRLIPFGWFELLTPPLGARVVFVDGLCALRSRTQLSSLLCLAPLLLVCRVQFTTFPPRRCFGVEIWAGGHDVFRWLGQRIPATNTTRMRVSAPGVDGPEGGPCRGLREAWRANCSSPHPGGACSTRPN